MKLGTLILLGIAGFLGYKYYQNATSLTVITANGITTLSSPSLTNANPTLNLSSVGSVLNSVETGIYGYFYNSQASGGAK